MDRLFKFDLIDIDGVNDDKTFKGIEDEVLNGFFARAIDHFYNENPKKSKDFITKRENFFKAF